MQNSHFNKSSNIDSDNESKSADQSLIFDQLNGLLKIEKKFLKKHEKLQNTQQPMEIEKDQLLKYKQQLVDINCPELNADIEETDAKLRNVNANISIVEMKIDSLENRYKSKMIEYAKNFILPSDMTPEIIGILKKHGITSSTLSDTPLIRSLKRPATEQSSSTANKSLITPKKTRNHQEALLAIKEAHRMRCVQLLEERKNLLDYLIELDNRKKYIVKQPVDNIDSKLEDIAKEWEDVQAQLQASHEQSIFEKKNLKIEIDKYTSQYMEEKDFNQNILQLIGHISPSNTQVVFQPDQTVDEPMPVLELEEPVEEPIIDESMPLAVDQIFPVPQEQDVPFSVDDCVAHLKQMLISSEQEIKSHDKYQRKLKRRHEAAKYGKLGDLDQNYRRMFTTEQIRYRMTRNTKNKLNSFKSHLRVTNIKHKLEMIDYIEKNLTPEQLTDEILDLLENKSTHSKSKNPETVAYDKQIKDLRILIDAEDELETMGSDLTDAIEKEIVLIDELTRKRNLEKAREYKQNVARREVDLDEILNEIEVNRRVYAAKYIGPKDHDNFVSGADLSSLLVQLIDDAKNQTSLTNQKNLGNRLKQLTDDLSNEFDQVISSIQSTSTSVNFSGRFDTFVPPKNEEIVVQVVGAEDANVVANSEQPDNHA